MILIHDGYVAEVTYEPDDLDMHGIVLNTSRPVLHFAGGSITELRQAFADTIADYRDWCKELGGEPEKP